MIISILKNNPIKQERFQVFSVLFMCSSKVSVDSAPTSAASECRLRLRKSDDDVIVSRDHARYVLDRIATRFAAQQVAFTVA